MRGRPGGGPKHRTPSIAAKPFQSRASRASPRPCNPDIVRNSLSRREPPGATAKPRSHLEDQLVLPEDAAGAQRVEQMEARAARRLEAEIRQAAWRRRRRGEAAHEIEEKSGRDHGTAVA